MKHRYKYLIVLALFQTFNTEAASLADETNASRQMVSYTSVIKGISWKTEVEPQNTFIKSSDRKCDLKLPSEKYGLCLLKVAQDDLESKLSKIKNEVKAICNLKYKTQDCRLEKIEKNCQLHNGAWSFATCLANVDYSYKDLPKNDKAKIQDNGRNVKPQNSFATEANARARAQSKVSEK